MKLASIAATVAVVAVGEIPGVGTVASLILDLASSALLDQLSATESEASDWDSIRTQVQVEVQREQVRQAVADARGHIMDRQTQIVDLLRTQESSSRSEYLNNLQIQITGAATSAAASMASDPFIAFHTLGYFGTLASLHLGLLRLHANEKDADAVTVQSSDTVDEAALLRAEASELQVEEQHSFYLDKYVAYAQVLSRRAWDWRESQITSTQEWRSSLLTGKEEYRGECIDAFPMPTATRSDVVPLVTTIDWSPDNRKVDNYRTALVDKTRSAFRARIDPYLAAWRPGASPAAGTTQLRNHQFLAEGETLGDATSTGRLTVRNGLAQFHPRIDGRVLGDAEDVVDDVDWDLNGASWARQFDDHTCVHLRLVDERLSVFAGEPWERLQTSRPLWQSPALGQDQLLDVAFNDEGWCCWVTADEITVGLWAGKEIWSSKTSTNAAAAAVDQATIRPLSASLEVEKAVEYGGTAELVWVKMWARLGSEADDAELCGWAAGSDYTQVRVGSKWDLTLTRWAKRIKRGDTLLMMGRAVEYDQFDPNDDVGKGDVDSAATSRILDEAAKKGIAKGHPTTFRTRRLIQSDDVNLWLTVEWKIEL